MWSTRTAAITVMVLVGVATSAATAQADPEPPEPPPAPPAPMTTIDADGTYAVGTEIQPGTYSSAGPIGSGACYWKRVSGSDLVDNALTKKAAIVQIAPTDTAFTTNECQSWQLTDAPPPPQPGAGDILGQLGQIILRNPGGNPGPPPPPSNP